MSRGSIGPDPRVARIDEALRASAGDVRRDDGLRGRAAWPGGPIGSTARGVWFDEHRDQPLRSGIVIEPKTYALDVPQGAISAYDVRPNDTSLNRPCS